MLSEHDKEGVLWNEKSIDPTDRVSKAFTVGPRTANSKESYHSHFNSIAFRLDAALLSVAASMIMEKKRRSIMKSFGCTGHIL